MGLLINVWIAWELKPNWGKLNWSATVIPKFDNSRNKLPLVICDCPFIKPDKVPIVDWPFWRKLLTPFNCPLPWKLDILPISVSKLKIRSRFFGVRGHFNK